MFLRKISVRIGVWYSLAFLMSALLLYGLTSLLLLRSLETKDRELLIEKVHEYSSLFARDGVNGLKLRVTSREIKHARDFVVRLADPAGKTLFLHSPDRSDDEDAPQIHHIDAFLQARNLKEGWIKIPADDFGDDVEIRSEVLPTGDVLQIGKDTEDREAFFHTFTMAYFQGMGIIFLFAIATGGLLSNRLLKPIRSLTQTVESIRSGNPKARVPLHSSQDELRELGALFNQMLEQNERLMLGMRETVDNVAHDLRTPIMRLRNAVEQSVNGEQDPQKLREALLDCHENSEIILRLVNGIMDISEAGAGSLPLSRELVSSKLLAEGVLDLYSFVAEEKRISLVIKNSGAFSVVGDKMRLLQALSNLVDNAIKYSSEQTTVEIETNVKNGLGEISVTDQGPGIDEKDHHRIWDRLYRGDISRSTRGLGLGLSLVKAIVDAHKGTVDVTSNPLGRGARFTISLPLTWIDPKITKM